MKPPGALVYANVTADLLRTVNEVKAELIAQITSMVRWREISAKIIEHKPGLLVELGPGNTLRGLIIRWLRHQTDPARLSRWTESTHLTDTASELRATLQALDSYSHQSLNPEPPP
jgi:malonyl CoA-acyl carrier protein transacylase